MKKITSLILALALCFGAQAADREHTLKVYNWADYIDEGLLSEFEQWYKEQTGEEVKVIYQLFDINEVMLSKIELGHEDFDVVCPSEYIIERMLRNNLLLPLDRNFGDTPDYTANVAPYMTSLLDQTDGSGRNANDYAVPYMWGTTGLLYNTKYISKEETRSWDVLKNPDYKGKVFVKDAFRDVYTSLIISLNRSRIDAGEVTVADLCSNVTPERIEQVENWLNEIRDNVSGWEADFGKELMTKEHGWINLSWSGDAEWAIEEAEKVGVSLDYTVPDAGAIVWFDCWVIPKYAVNTRAANYFINYLCMPENALRNMDVIGYVSAIGGPEILAAKEDYSYPAEDASYFFGEAGKDVHINPIQYPENAIITRCGMMHDAGTEELLAMWTRVKGDNANTFTFIIIGIVIVALITGYVVSKAKGKKKKHGKNHR